MTVGQHLTGTKIRLEPNQGEGTRAICLLIIELQRLIKMTSGPIQKYHYYIDVYCKFTSNKALKYGLQADNTILCALHVCPSHASVTSVKLFSFLRCLNDDTMLLW